MQDKHPFRPFLPFIRWVSVCLSLYVCLFFKGDKEGKPRNQGLRGTNRTEWPPYRTTNRTEWSPNRA